MHGHRRALRSCGTDGKLDLTTSVNVLRSELLYQRKVYLEEAGPKFWDQLDSTLAEIRAEAGGKAKKITKYVYYFIHQYLITQCIVVQGLPPHFEEGSGQARHQRLRDQ